MASLVRELTADVVIVGAGVGGVAAALAALDAGSSVIMTEETDWIGGQFTAQAVPADEHPWIEQFGATRGYQLFRTRVREYFRANYPLTALAQNTPALNPGAGRVSGFCTEPRIALAVLESMIAPWMSSGRLTVLLRTRPVSAEVDGDAVTAVELRDLETGGAIWLRGAYFLDATETGELLPLAGVEFVTGAESRNDTGEDHAPDVANPLNVQAASICFAMSHHEGEDHTIDRPVTYDHWREFRPAAWAGDIQIGLRAPHFIHHTMIDNVFEPNPPFDPATGPNRFDNDPTHRSQWLFRRILARGHLTTPGVSDITLVNWSSTDYLGGNLFGGTDDENARHLAAAREQSLSVLYWLQTEAGRHDGGTGYPGLRIRPDVVGTRDGLAKSPYHRESRRIEAVTRIVEQDVSTAHRDGKGVRHWGDSVGVGSYRIDLHPSTGGDNYIDVAAFPFEIPLGALLPKRVTNLLAAAKNIGTTHLTNGCYRLHPVEWNIGEAAGRLAAYCIRTGTTPHQVHATEDLLTDFQSELDRSGVERHWPELRSL